MKVKIAKASALCLLAGLLLMTIPLGISRMIDVFATLQYLQLLIIPLVLGLLVACGSLLILLEISVEISATWLRRACSLTRLVLVVDRITGIKPTRFETFTIELPGVGYRALFLREVPNLCCYTNTEANSLVVQTWNHIQRSKMRKVIANFGGVITQDVVFTRLSINVRYQLVRLGT